MTERQKIRQVISKLRTYWPITTPEECQSYGIRLCKTGKSGVYRHVYKVWGLPLVIKFPCTDDDKVHAIQEWIVYNKLKYCDKYKKLKKYIPTIYHFNMNTGVSAMRYYRVLGPSNWRQPNHSDEIRDRLQKKVKKIYKHANDVDNSGNVARDKNGQLKIIDLGCFDEVW
jgi:hypothetical protein